MSIDLDTARSLAAGRGKVYDADGNKIGGLGQVYVDDETGEPNWVTVKTGLFGLSESFAPLADARAEGDDLHVAASEEQVKAAPRVDPDGSLSADEEKRLYDYYASLDSARAADGSADRRPSTHDERSVEEDETEQPRANAASRPTADHDQPAGDEQQPLATGQRLRLRKYVVTEEATVTVPVQREEIRLEPEPDDTGADVAGPTDRADR